MSLLIAQDRTKEKVAGSTENPVTFESAFWWYIAFVCSVFIQLVNIMIIFARWFLACRAEKWVPLRKTLRGYYRYEWPIKFGQSCCWAAGKFRRNLAQIVVEIWFEVARKNIGIGLRHHPNHKNLKFLHVFWMAGWPGLKKVWRQRWKENLYIFLKWTLNSSVSKADEKPKDYCISLYPFILCDSLFVIQICQNPSEASISFAPIHMVPSFAPPVEHISDIILQRNATR